MRSCLALPVLVLAACANPPAPPPTLPAAATPAAAVAVAPQDPVIAVGQEVGAFFRNPPADDPAAAARALAELEWLAATLPGNPRWANLPGPGMLQLMTARNQAREALGIPRQARPQAVIDGLSAAAAALAAGDRAAVGRALPRATFPLGAEETVRRLSGPPRVPGALGALTALSAARTVNTGGGGAR